MAGISQATLVVLVAFAAVLSTAAAAAGNGTSSPTAYEMLEQYNFPRGILPEGVTGYKLRPDGGFEVYFPRACEFLLSHTWLVRYDARISGDAASGSSRRSLGSAKVLFLWNPRRRGDRVGDSVSFYVGPVATSFPIADFARQPHRRQCAAATLTTPPPRPCRGGNG
ncbi:hypothetical protein PR202_gb00282 [Eleusine coracana subsp. coracana]|uniref:Uncharacterized protein n=1 Tax=Eleusine coracana subsp. coracana TaxID=191504 RepID=A0AAV5DTH8_ELECO|nr:hypothetical protein PR202_gb00282 [Eleusine coracana subsp. coracana]